MSITIDETPTEKRWILQGQLVGPWVRELRTSWETAHRDCSERTCIVDLTDGTFIDKGGERLLRAMSQQAVQFVADRLYIRRLLVQLERRSKSQENG